MSITPLDHYPPAVQQALVSGNVNAQILYNFLMGIYSVMYIGTMCLYNARKDANQNSLIVLSALSLLYLSSIGDFLMMWYFTDLAIVIDGETRASMLVSYDNGGSDWMFTMDYFLYNFIFVISDSLLIWRCYHLWGRSVKTIMFPLVAFLTEFGLFITLVSENARLNNSDAEVVFLNRIQSALAFVSLLTTAISTCLIGYRIYSASRSSPRSSKRLFTRIVVIVFESAAVYSVILLIYALYYVIPGPPNIGLALYTAQYFLSPVTTFVAGMAPTVMVARIALTNLDRTNAHTISHISGLQSRLEQVNEVPR